MRIYSGRYTRQPVLALARFKCVASSKDEKLLRNPSLIELLDSGKAPHSAQISGVAYSPTATRRRTTRATSTRGRRPSRRPSRRRAPWPPTPHTAAASAAWRSASPPHPHPDSHGSDGGAAGSRRRALIPRWAAVSPAELNASKALVE